MSVANFVPEVWSALLLEILQAKTDLRSLTRRDYEGEIRQSGDVVHINQFAGTTVNTFADNGADITFDSITSTTQDLTIDQKRYFAMDVRDVDQIQANIDLKSPVLQDIALKMMQNQNSHLLTTLVAGLTTTPIDASASIDLDDVKSARVLLNRNELPKDGRWGVISPEMEGDFLGNTNFINADQYGSREALLDGEIGRIFGFRILVDTQVTQSGLTPDQYEGVFFHESAIAWAQQKELTIEAGRHEKDFSDYLKGFALFGAKVVQPTAGVVVTRNV
jgi:N4-gp56 family major capsid protein